MLNQRGEGKLGCIISLLIMGILVAISIKAVPVYYGNSELIDACDFIASSAANKPIETLEREVKQKAAELGVVERGAAEDSVGEPPFEPLHGAR